MKNYLKITLGTITLSCLSFCLSLTAYGQGSSSGGPERLLSGHIQGNIKIPVTDYSTARISIDNKSVVIDGYWEFKDDAGQVLEEPVILSQPGGVNDIALFALRSPGEARVTIEENGETIVYRILVKSRYQANEVEKEVEQAIFEFVNDPGLKLKILPPQAAIVGRNLNRAFGEETAAQVVAPQGETSGNATGQIVNADDFRPTILMEGTVENDIVVTKALSIAFAYTNNVINLMSIKNPLQIQLKCQVLSVQDDFLRNIGFQHFGNNTAAGFGLSFESTNFTSAAPFFNIIGNSNGTGATGLTTRGVPNVRTQLNLGLQKNMVRVLQEPVLTVRNGQAARFQVGDSFPIVTTSVDNGVVTESVEYVDSGIILRVAPIVEEEEVFREAAEGGGIPWETQTARESTQGDEVPLNRTVNTIQPETGHIEMVVQPLISVQNGTLTTGLGNQLPIFTRNQIETRVSMKHGQALVLGGLFNQSLSRTKNEVPFVTKIPVLGELFKNRNDDYDNRELIFVLTPKIMGFDDLEPHRYWDTKMKKFKEYGEDNKVIKPGVKPTRISAVEIGLRNDAEYAQPVQVVPSESIEVLPPNTEDAPSPSLEEIPAVEEVDIREETTTQPTETSESSEGGVEVETTPAENTSEAATEEASSEE